MRKAAPPPRSIGCGPRSSARSRRSAARRRRPVRCTSKRRNNAAYVRNGKNARHSRVFCRLMERHSGAMRGIEPGISIFPDAQSRTCGSRFASPGMTTSRHHQQIECDHRHQGQDHRPDADSP
ncbi:major facilitator superfamily transporter [Bradyrhizobium elkanii USDA 61]|nr:major facilitator superfamily transporter [Bradyrhizobium elkanii USDA 61]